MIARAERELPEERNNFPTPLRRPLFSARMVADTMPSFNPELPYQVWNFTSQDRSGYPLKIQITSKKEETQAIIDEMGGRKTTLKITETPTKAFYELREEGCKQPGFKDFSAGIILTFVGKFWTDIDGMGILNQITDARNAPYRSRAAIANIPPQGTADFEKWEKISRGFMRLEDALERAHLVEEPVQPVLL